jgi:hypothetical protein
VFSVEGLGFSVLCFVLSAECLVFSVECLVFGDWCLVFSRHLQRRGLSWTRGTRPVPLFSVERSSFRV